MSDNYPMTVVIPTLTSWYMVIDLSPGLTVTFPHLRTTDDGSLWQLPRVPNFHVSKLCSCGVVMRSCARLRCPSSSRRALLPKMENVGAGVRKYSAVLSRKGG